MSADSKTDLPHRPMGCDELRHDLALFIDGELAEPESDVIEQHLSASAACRTETDRHRSLQRAIRSAARPAAPDHLRTRISAALDAEPAPSTSRRWARRFIRPLPVAVASTAALGLVAWINAASHRDELARDIVARHARHLPPEVMTNDPAQVESWIADKVPFRVRVPRPIRPDLDLVGARLADMNNRSAVYLIYGNHQSPAHRVSMVVFDDSHRTMPAMGQPSLVEDHEIFTTRASGFNVASWKRDEVIYTIVGDHDEDVTEIVRAAYR